MAMGGGLLLLMRWAGRGLSQQGGASGKPLLTAVRSAHGTGAKPGSRRAGPEQTPLTALPVPASTARCAGGTGKGEAAGGGRGVVAVWGRDGRGRAPNDEDRREASGWYSALLTTSFFLGDVSASLHAGDCLIFTVVADKTRSRTGITAQCNTLGQQLGVRRLRHGLVVVEVEVRPAAGVQVAGALDAEERLVGCHAPLSLQHRRPVLEHVLKSGLPRVLTNITHNLYMQCAYIAQALNPCPAAALNPKHCKPAPCGKRKKPAKLLIENGISKSLLLLKIQLM
ncbi:unnamed protein product [Miscanthus lutarioriparius]|uniref:Uncharacterized protein n=1 Tax=Miscanthus lutarioriparius TaxID=422564 RepID=A0A811NQW1_9POAL|nr:unnamed protein product [Miscanthus lutarioriparius]